MRNYIMRKADVEPAMDMDDIGPCILEEEVATAIKELKNNKAEGIDEIPTELLKCMGNTAVKVFFAKNL